MSIKGTVNREISRAVQTHVIRPLTDKAVAAAVRHGPRLLKTIAAAVGGVLFNRTKHLSVRQDSIHQTSFRIIDESEAKVAKRNLSTTLKRQRKATKKQ